MPGTAAVWMIATSQTHGEIATCVTVQGIRTGSSARQVPEDHSRRASGTLHHSVDVPPASVLPHEPAPLAQLPRRPRERVTPSRGELHDAAAVPRSTLGGLDDAERPPLQTLVELEARRALRRMPGRQQVMPVAEGEGRIARPHERRRALRRLPRKNRSTALAERTPTARTLRRGRQRRAASTEGRAIRSGEGGHTSTLRWRRCRLWITREVAGGMSLR